MAESQTPAPFRLTVLNPGGRDPAQQFRDGPSLPGKGHQPTNFHAYAACTGGAFHRDVAAAIAEETPVLLLLRGDFKESERSLEKLQTRRRKVAVSLKETGLHQIADQLGRAGKLARFLRVVEKADGCIAPTPEAAELYRSIRGSNGGVAFIPTPYPMDCDGWKFGKAVAEQRGIFIGTREFEVLSRNHLAALFLGRQLSTIAGEPVTVFNYDRRKGARLLGELRFPPGRLRVEEGRLSYPDYLRVAAAHKLVLQLDTSFVPGQVAGDALLAGVPCVGGNGAIERLVFPHTCGWKREIGDLARIAKTLLSDTNAREAAMSDAMENARRSVSFGVVREQLKQFYTGLASA